MGFLINAPHPVNPVNPVLIKLDFIPPLAVFAIFCLLTRPGHLRKLMGRRMKAGERDEFRASLVRGKLAGTKLNA
ncbi:MAG: hypothetical protein U1G05_07160 [Kiritimatiellia bacterium]